MEEPFRISRSKIVDVGALEVAVTYDGVTGYTIWLGDPDDMASRAQTASDADVERVRAVRSVTSLPLQVDVNEYWSLDEALEFMSVLASLRVEYVEQPLAAGDPDGPVLEGQGSITHPFYSDVTLGLYHGAAPQLLVLCHRVGARELDPAPGHLISPLGELVDLYERLALPARPARVVAVALEATV